MSQSASTSVSGPVTVGDNSSPDWLLPAAIVGVLLVAGLAWLFTRKH